MNLVRNEINHVISKYKADSIDFWADTFLAMSEYEFDEFIEMYSDIKLPFWIQNRTETVTEKKFQKLLDVGLMRVDFGIEHGNEEFRATMLDRKVSSEKIIEDLKLLNHFDIKYSVNNIIGFPNETRELAMDTILINKQINADTRNMYTFTPFHGTPLRDIAIEQGLIEKNALSQSLSSPTILDMPQFSASAIGGLKRCFVPYVLLGEDRWPEIKKAETFRESLKHHW